MTSDSNTRVVLVQQHPTLADGVLAALLKICVWRHGTATRPVLWRRRQHW
ncbi:MAG: hypothetical protein HC914_02085 [Chloroflexaceae bacterium]|nr:hypothetical protein [Chloroflexaceae bacterium]